MNTRQRGLITFGILLFVAIVFCGWLPFVAMPGAGVGMALPVIEVPGEVVTENFFLGVDLTNTIIGTLFADFMVFLFALLAWRASNGWRKEIPGRFQGFVEMLVEGLYNFFKGIAGERLKTKRPIPLWPLCATIFLFLLAANYMKLFPGVETVGKMHCAHIGKSGYPIVEGSANNTFLLYVDAPLDAGTSQTEETEHICHEYFEKRLAGEVDGEVALVSAEETEHLNQEIAALNSQIEAIDGEIEHLEASLGGEAAADDHGEVTEDHSEAATETEATAEGEVATEEAATETEATVEGEGEEATEEAATETEATVEGEGEEAAAEDDHAEVVGVTTAEIEAQIAAFQAERDALVIELNLANTRLVYPEATLPLTQEQLDKGVIPYIFHITPYFRGPATDLSLTIALALMSMVMVQVYGVTAQGLPYFEKFINVSALGNIGKKPMGAIDFLVGLIEIISEIGKIVSLAFRLFGNLFAGGVALMAISFLVALIVPGIIYGLEVIIGSVQALVFAVLTLVFSVQAMEAHHGDDDEAHH